MTLWNRVMEAKVILATWREILSPTSVTKDTDSLEMQVGHVSLMENGQGFSLAVMVCSMLHCNFDLLKLRW